MTATPSSLSKRAITGSEAIEVGHVCQHVVGQEDVRAISFLEEFAPLAPCVKKVLRVRTPDSCAFLRGAVRRIDTRARECRPRRSASACTRRCWLLRSRGYPAPSFRSADEVLASAVSEVLHQRLRH